MRGHHDRPQRRVSVVHAAARGGPRDQPRGHPPDARVRPDGAGLRRPRALRPRLHRIRRRHLRRKLRRARPRRRPGVQQLLRAVQVRGRAAGPLPARPAVDDHAPQHHRRRQSQRLDVGVQRPVLAAARVRAGPVRGRPRGRQRPGRRGPGRLRGRRHLRDRRTLGRDRRDLPPDRRRPARARSRDQPAGQPLLPSPGAEGAARPTSSRPQLGDSNDGTTIEGGQAYFPYFSIKTEFDDVATRARLEPAGIKVSPLGDYMDRLLDFATRSRWGKRPIARVEALAS